MGSNAGLSRPTAPSLAGPTASDPLAAEKEIDGRATGWWHGRMAGRAGFVGREDELSRLLGALGGDARLVLVVGDAGAGKTRFVGEGIARAEAMGMTMLRGDCLPLSATLPLLPVADALGELAGRDGGRLLAAALDAASGYVRREIERLLPAMSETRGAPADGRDGEWSRERLFAGVAEVLAAATRKARSGVGLVVEDVHWADAETLDCLTFLARTGSWAGVRVVATCRGDEAPLPAHVAGWLAQVRAGSGVEEIRLGPLSRAEVARQITSLIARPVSPRVIQDLYARAEGNPFFTEQLVAAALTGGVEGDLRVPAELPARLAELLTARADRCAGDARAVLAGLAVAARPLTEGQLHQVTELDDHAVRQGLRELAAARLLAEGTAGGGHRPRHALLAEAVAGGLLAGERMVLHERTARALSEDPALAAEVAGHWQVAGRPAEELSARVAAAEAAERVFGYAQAAAHRQRVIELSQAHPDIAVPAAIDLPRCYVQAIDALYLAGESQRAGALAQEAYRHFAADADPATAAVAHHRAAFFQMLEAPAAGLPLMQEALRLFELTPPSYEHAHALLDYAAFFVQYVEERLQANVDVLNRALQIAEAAGATALIPRTVSTIAYQAFMRGQVEEGFAALERGRASIREPRDSPALVWLAGNESDALLKLAQYERAAEVGSRGFEAARRAGLQAWNVASFLAVNAAEALLALGRTQQAAALIDPLTAMPADRIHWIVQVVCAEIDLLRGEADAAAEWWRQIYAMPAVTSRVDFAYEAAPQAAEAALWAGRPGDALAETQRAVALFKVPDLTIMSGRLLGAGLRACADLAERARARRHGAAAAAASTAAESLVTWIGQMGGAPFADHPFVAVIPAQRATWDAERTRLDGPSDPDAWAAAAKAWQDLDCPHRAGYAWWRQAGALLEAGQPATTATGALRAAAGAADGHAPLLDQIRALAERARIPLQAADAPRPAQPPTGYGLTGRELTVLRLLVAGHTNAQIGAELYISPKTAGVHVSNILRKLGVSGRVQAAALAERADLLRSARF